MSDMPEVYSMLFVQKVSFFRDSGCIFIWSVYVYLLFRGLYESYPQNESEEFVEWKSALYDSFFLQKNSRFE